LYPCEAHPLAVYARKDKLYLPISPYLFRQIPLQKSLDYHNNYIGHYSTVSTKILQIMKRVMFTRQDGNALIGLLVPIAGERWEVQSLFRVGFFANHLPTIWLASAD
jgi:hypothetical protein